MRDIKNSTKTPVQHNRVFRSRSGFTLIELIIYLGIIGVVLSSFVVFTLGVNETRNKNLVIQEVQANNRIALEVISRTIRASTGINLGSSVFNTDPGVLSLEMSDLTKDPTVINLDQDNGILQITEGSNSPIKLTTDKVNVTNLVFTNLSPSNNSRQNIKINISTQFSNPSSDIEYEYSQDLQTTVSLRQ